MIAETSHIGPAAYELRSDLRRYGAIAIGLALNGATTYGVTIVAARTLATDDLARYLTVLALALIAAQIAMASVVPAAARAVAASFHAGRFVPRSAPLIVAAGAAVSCLVAAPLVAVGLVGATVADVGIAVAVVGSLVAYSAAKLFLLALHDQRRYLTGEAANAVVVIVATIVLVGSGRGGATLLLALVGGNLALATFAFARLRPLARPAPLRLRQEYLSFSLFALVATVGSVCLVPACLVALTRTSAGLVPEFGLLMAAVTPLLLISQAIAYATFADYAGGASEAARRRFRLGCWLSISAVTAIALAAPVLAAPIVRAAFDLTGVATASVVVATLATATRMLVAPIGGAMAGSGAVRFNAVTYGIALAAAPVSIAIVRPATLMAALTLYAVLTVGPALALLVVGVGRYGYPPRALVVAGAGFGVAGVLTWLA